MLGKNKHENYLELIWMLAKTDFKLRYQGSILGYVWAILKPLMLFSILNFVFSSIFNTRGNGIEYYSLQLLVSIVFFNFFSEGTSAGLASLLSKSSLVTKIYIPRWTIILASTIHTALVFVTNLLVIGIFFAYYKFTPSFIAIGMMLFFSLLTFALILIFSFFAAPLYLKFRDFKQIWDVVLSALFYASPIVYPLQMLPAWTHKIILSNPIAFIIHFLKTSLIENRPPEFFQIILFLLFLCLAGTISFFVYKKMEKNIAENI